MQDIELSDMPPAFVAPWRAAVAHLERQVQGGVLGWLRDHPHPPFREHLSFRLGNQLFFVRVEDVEGGVRSPGGRRGLATVAREAGGWACLMPMRKAFAGEHWLAEVPGWGLLEAASGEPLDPVALVSAERIEMTPWELHGLAVREVLERIRQQGFVAHSWQGYPDADPAIWFVGASGGLEWVVVRAARFPARRAERPEHWQEIVDFCATRGPVGHFVSVVLASAEQPQAAKDEPVLPLWRGHGIRARVEWLE